MGSNTGFGLAFTLLASLAGLYYFRRLCPSTEFKRNANSEED